MGRTLTLTAVFLLSMSACTHDDATAPPEEPPPTDRNVDVTGEWELVGGTVDGEPIPILPTYPVTMILREGQVSGVAACNSYGGTYEIDASTIRIGELAVTMMACEPDAMESEQAFMSTLQQSLAVARDGAMLSMVGEGVDLTFRHIAPAEPAALVGAVWHLVTMIQGDAASSVVGDPTLVLGDDGTFEASTGCRTLTGTYRLSSDHLAVGQMSASGDCPENLARQDGQVIGVLEAARVTVDGDRLRLTAAGGDGLEYTAGEAADVDATDPSGSWRLVDGTFDGEPIPLVPSHPITAEFDGTHIVGRSACNDYAIEYQLAGSTLHTGEMEQTQEGCESPIIESEETYLAAMIGTFDLSLDDDTLRLLGQRAELWFERG